MKKLLIVSSLSLFMLIVSSCALFKNQGRDGLTRDTAWKVSNIAEEYQFAARKCPDCKFVLQTLGSDSSGHPIDILAFEKPNGEQISYYFDISSFYGKKNMLFNY